MTLPLQFGFPVGPELLVLLAFTMLPFLIALVVSALVYRGARDRNSNHALAWAVGAFFGGVVVWILYLVVRDEIGPGGPSAGRRA